MAGVKLFYICRFDNNRKPIRVNPFPSIFPRSLNQLLFQDLETMRDTIARITEYESGHGEVVQMYDHCYCSDHFWLFVKRNLGPTFPVFHTRRRKENTTRNKNTKTKLEGSLQEEVVRFENEVHFEKFMDIFGRKPKVICTMLAPSTE
jgi:hypothetical protein